MFECVCVWSPPHTCIIRSSCSGSVYYGWMDEYKKMHAATHEEGIYLVYAYGWTIAPVQQDLAQVSSVQSEMTYTYDIYDARRYYA